MAADPDRQAVAPRVLRRSFADEVADHIRSRIFDGSLKADQRVPQDKIALELGVSRVPVREALIALEESGLVAAEHQRGVFVVPIHQEDIEDHYQMYGMIQSLAAVRAVDRITDATLGRLQRLHEQMAGDPANAYDLNYEFHQLINRTGGSKRVRAMLRHLSNNLAKELFRIPPSVDARARAEHADILAALRAGDRTTLETVNREHVRREGEFVLAALRRNGVLAD